MSPELLVPEEFGKKGSVPTPQADIYAFGMVVFQVREWIDGISLSYIYFLQVLKGETPFRYVLETAIAYHVLSGYRPDKPENAVAIGFSDSLWAFTERCWDGKMELRPEVGEVVEHIWEAVASWDGLMPPSSRADAAPGSEEAYSDLTEPSEFNVPILPRHYLSCSGADPFALFASHISENATKSGLTAEPFNGPTTPPSSTTTPSTSTTTPSTTTPSTSSLSWNGLRKRILDFFRGFLGPVKP